jgi:hypothetical protein
VIIVATPSGVKVYRSHAPLTPDERPNQGLIFGTANLCTRVSYLALFSGNLLVKTLPLKLVGNE